MNPILKTYFCDYYVCYIYIPYFTDNQIHFNIISFLFLMLLPPSYVVFTLKQCLLEQTEDSIMPLVCQTKLMLWTGSKLHWQLATIHQKLKRIGR